MPIRCTFFMIVAFFAIGQLCWAQNDVQAVSDVLERGLGQRLSVGQQSSLSEALLEFPLNTSEQPIHLATSESPDPKQWRVLYCAGTAGALPVELLSGFGGVMVCTDKHLRRYVVGSLGIGLGVGAKADVGVIFVKDNGDIEGTYAGFDVGGSWGLLGGRGSGYAKLGKESNSVEGLAIILCYSPGAFLGGSLAGLQIMSWESLINSLRN